MKLRRIESKALLDGAGFHYVVRCGAVRFGMFVDVGRNVVRRIECPARCGCAGIFVA